jgi:putative chitinase
MTPLLHHVQAAGVEKDTATGWLPWLQGTCKAYEINTPHRIAGFLSQIAHESAGLTRLTENLNYSAEGLMRTWPSRFKTLAFAQQYHRQPQRIANLVYANRMGNGDEASGDGWRYRGRGLKQLTGKTNYAAFSDAIGEDYVAEPDLLLEPVNAALSAGWFWNTNGLNQIADRGDVAAMTRRINGGLIGLEDRQRRFNACMAAVIG